MLPSRACSHRERFACSAHADSAPLHAHRQVSAILLEIHHANVHLAVASRTSAPKAYVARPLFASHVHANALLTCRARQALTELLIPGVLRDTERDMLKQKSAKDVRQVVSSINLFDTMEI